MSESGVRWREWGGEAFAEAERERKPILLSIGAVWCHWCHVMDRTSYADPAVLATIAERYVPIKVDNDRRPDINARYNMGGWPTTALLTPDGEILAGATYVPPPQMRIMLEEVADLYRDRKAEIDVQLAERLDRMRERPPADDVQPSLEALTTTLDALASTYDDEYGGFGMEPKFPMTPALEFLLLVVRLGRDPRAERMLSKTLVEMARGGMYDHVEGGFFRYSTTRDWSVPHFEKMSEDHAGLVRLYALSMHALGIPALRATLLATLGYLRTVLRNPGEPFFAGSQDADEAYYALPLEARRERPAPYVDRSIYANWNAALGAAFIIAGRELDDDAIVAEGVATLDGLHERMRDAAGLLYHFCEPGGTPQLPDLLGDQVAYLQALLDAYETTGEPRFRARAVALAGALRAFAGDDGLLVDRRGTETLGRLAFAERPLEANAAAADAFLRLAIVEDDVSYRERANAILRGFGTRYAAARAFASPYAAAVARALYGGASVAIVGGGDGAARMREVAHRLPDPLLVVSSFAADDPALEARGFAGRAQVTTAYVCRGVVCGPPLEDPATLRASFDALAARTS